MQSAFYIAIFPRKAVMCSGIATLIHVAVDQHMMQPRGALQSMRNGSESTTSLSRDFSAHVGWNRHVGK